MVLYASFDFERQSRIISLRLQKIPQNIFLVETRKTILSTLLVLLLYFL